MSGAGRADRMRVEQNLFTARHGAQLLDRKQHILADELERLELKAERSRRVWEEQAQFALKWLGRAAALDGVEGIDAASPSQLASVEVQWGSAMGVNYPEAAECTLPSPAQTGGSSALSFATEASRSALVAAVQHAAVLRALRLVSDELAASRVRQRAVENRWIPRLESELHTIRRHLEEQELEEALRLRWAADRTLKGSGSSSWGLSGSLEASESAERTGRSWA